MTGIQVRFKAATSLPELLTHVLMVIAELLIVIKIMIIISGGIVVPDTVPRLLQMHYLTEWSHQSRVVLSFPHIRNKKRRLGGVN